MSFLDAVRSFFNPAPPAIQTRDEMILFEHRAAAGMNLYAPSQINRPVWMTGNPARYVSEGWGKAPVVFACVLALADAVATAPIIVQRNMGSGDLEPDEDSDLQFLLNRPNPSMDQAEFLQAVTVISALSGFCVMEKERDRAGNILALWPLRSDWVRPIPRSQSAPAWEYRVPGYRDPFILEPEDVIVHTHAPDPNMGYTGTAPMAVAFRELGIENAMTDFLKAFFDRGALPVYGIIPRQQITNQEQADAFRERVVGRYGGALRSAEPLLLTGVEDVKRLGFDFDELAYPQLRSLSEVSICAAFRVPPILISIQAGLDKATYSNYSQARRSFYEDVIMSLWRRIDGALTRSLVSEFDVDGTLSVEFDMADVPALKDDANALWQRATAALQAGGISLHTYQRLLGLDPHGEDVIYRPFSATPIPIIEGGKRNRSTGRVTSLPMPQLPAGRSVRSIVYDSDEHRQRWERHVGMTERWETVFADALAKRLTAQQQDVLDQLTDGERAVREIVPDNPFDKSKWIRDFKLFMRPVVVGIVGKQAELAADELGLTFAFDVQDPNVIRAMETQLQRFAEEVNETTWQRLRASIAEGIGDGESIGQIAERVEAVMTDRIRSSKEAIARTEVTASSTIGTRESWRQSGVVKGKRWLAALDDRTRPTHVEAHGQTVGLDDDFTVGGATGPGPGMLNDAGEVVNCRCSMVPVLDVEDDQ